MECKNKGFNFKYSMPKGFRPLTTIEEKICGVNGPNNLITMMNEETSEVISVCFETGVNDYDEYLERVKLNERNLNMNYFLTKSNKPYRQKHDIPTFKMVSMNGCSTYETYLMMIDHCVLSCTVEDNGTESRKSLRNLINSIHE